MAWTDLAPWFFRGDDGAVTGFAVEIGTELGTGAGFTLAPFEVGGVADWSTAQNSGQSVIIPAVARLPRLQDNNLFSDPILETQVRLTVLTENEGSFDPTTLDGQRIGVLAPGAGSDPALLPGAQLFPYPNTRAALIGLLAGEIDAISAEAAFVFAEARTAKLDYRIAFVGAPLQTVERVVAIHQSRADLIAPINAEIARMKADGRIDDIKARYDLVIPEPAPDVLRVGVFDLPPHMGFTATGQPTGFAIEVFEDVAEIAGLSYEFVPIQMADLLPGDTHDILPILSITEERQNFTDFAYPIESSEFAIFMRAGEADGIKGLADLADLRVGAIGVSVAARLAQEAGLSGLQTYTTDEPIKAKLDDLLANKIDAVLFETQAVNAIIDAQDYGDRIAQVQPPFFVSQRAPALRPGLGTVRQRLNATIPGYLISEDFAQLRQKYFGSPVFWTTERLAIAGAVFGFVTLLSTLVFLFINLNARTRAAEAEARAAKSDGFAAEQGRFLEAIYNAASSGILALDRDQTVVRANDEARHLLGGISDPTPFPWPDGLNFLDAETLKPLDASADPIRRALTGHRLHGETHLLRRLQDGEDRRYVRLQNAKLETEDGGTLTVMVLDDVSNEERNRQVIERKSRLDALGQLTGGIAHDFNNLLASQLYALDLAAKAKTDERRNTLLASALRSIERGRALTSRLLSFARKQPGLASGRLVTEVFSDFEKLIGPMLEAKITLSFDVEEPDLRVFCDQAQLETALMNLVLNSRDAIMRADKGDRIDLKARSIWSGSQDLKDRQQSQDSDNEEASHSFRYAEIVVSDNGPGMDEETLARSTDPFFTTKEDSSGTGLGLAMVYGFIRQSDGSLKIYSEPGLGTSVQMTLPRGSVTGTREEPKLAPLQKRGSGETILVAEDEYELLGMKIEVLEDLGYQVIAARSGQEALEVAEAGTAFDLLLTDVVMPGQIGGFELARRLRELRPDLPVIYMSGYTGFTASEMGEVQAPILQKPSEPGELSEAIEKLLSERQASMDLA